MWNKWKWRKWSKNRRNQGRRDCTKHWYCKSIQEGRKWVKIEYIVIIDRLYGKQDYAAAINSYRMSLSYCPLDDEYNKDRVDL